MENPPIPLCFSLVEYNLTDVIKMSRVIFLGPRFQNSLKMHEKYSNRQQQVTQVERDSNGLLVQVKRDFQQYPYKMPKTLGGMLKYDEAQNDFSLNMGPSNDNQARLQAQLKHNQSVQEQFVDGRKSLVFDSDFESGNLDIAALTNFNRNDEYDLLIRLDSNSRTHQQWFYFSVDSTNRGKYRNTKVRFNLLNFTKPRSLYQQGMKPVVWSEKLYKDQGIAWHHAGDDVQYFRSRLKRLNYVNSCQCLSFDYTFKYDDDKVFFAYAGPYTYSMLCSFIKEIELA